MTTDLAACRAAIRTGSHSFHAASLLLPRRVREPALALYAFCRSADDAVDAPGGGACVARLHARLERACRGRPDNDPVDRAFAAMVAEHAIPQALPAALLDGFAWDAEGRRYATLGELHAYAARVAGSVGVMMGLLLGARDRDALARACDLGIAMQLTNIARDVGEDAAAGRLYLPGEWLADEGIGGLDPRKAPREALESVLRRLLGEADRLYARADAGIAVLPRTCRPSILAARHIYRAIGGHVLRDGIGRRARTSTAEKLLLSARALVGTGWMAMLPRSAVLHARPLAAAAFLVDAACGPPPPIRWGPGRAGSVLGVLAQLAAHDRRRGMAGAVG